MKVTFDSNVWRIIASPDIFPKEPKLQSFRTIRRAIINKKITPCISETTFTLEAIRKQKRKEFFASYKPQISISEEIQPDGTIKIAVSMGPNKTSHPGNNGYLSLHLSDALSIGFKLLRCPRISGITNPHIAENLFLDDSQVHIKERQDNFAVVAKEIETKGTGISHIKAIGSKYDPKNWINGIRKAPENEIMRIAKAVAEWADGDSLAAHIAYKNDYFCTKDMAKSGGQDSIFAQHNRKYLEKLFGVIFVAPEELCLKIPP